MKHFSKLILGHILVLSAFTATAQSPALIGDIFPGSKPSDPGAFVPFDGKLIFIATDSVSGRELRSYSGTGVPALVSDLYSGTGNGCITPVARSLAVFGSKLYFCGSNGGGTGGSTAGELFAYDGTNPPTLVADIQPGVSASSPKDFIVMGGKLYFSASRLSTTGTELYSYDGIDTPVLHEIVPGVGGGYPAGLTAYNGKLYFAAVKAGIGQEFFMYDPVGDSASLVADIDPGSNGSYPIAFTVAAGKLWFGARTYLNGFELYSYDGSNVVRVTDLAPGMGDGLASYDIGPSTVEIGFFNNKIYFGGVEDGSGTQLYCHDPATGKTSLAATINGAGSSNLKYLTEYNGRLYFRAKSETNGVELWSTDGTSYSPVADLNPGSGSSNPMFLTVWNGALYMRADNGVTGNELYRLRDNTGITSAAFNGSVVLYPNPAHDMANLKLTLQKSEMISVGLFDIGGRRVWSKAPVTYRAGNTAVKIPLSGLSSGLYFYRLLDADRRMLAAGRIEKQ